MSRTASIQARVDPKTKTQANNVLSVLNMTMSEAISIFLKQIVLHKGIPFDVKIPNITTARTLKKSEKGQELHKVSSVNELFEELNA